MARLLGQLSLPASPTDALPLLHRAATLASTDVPQPAYVYGLLLLGEFSHVRIEERFLGGLIPAGQSYCITSYIRSTRHRLLSPHSCFMLSPGSSPLLEARKFVERAAYLGFAPAQYKLGHSYEYAVPPFPFDPLLSVQYYRYVAMAFRPAISFR